MRQVLFTIPIFGGLKVFGYGIMLVFAFVSSTWLAYWRAQARTARSRGHWRHVVLGFLFRSDRSRLFYCVEYWGDEIKKPLGCRAVLERGSGLLRRNRGGSGRFFRLRRFRPFPLRPYMDVLAPSIAVGTLFGRLGCFLNGCCFGDICRLPWAVSFPAYSPPWVQHVRSGIIEASALTSLPVHPTQIYSAIDALVIFLLLTAYYPLRRRDGEVIGLLMLVYPISRFAIEYLRNDEGVFFGGMTISQTISVTLLLLTGLYWAWLSRLPKGIYRDLAPTDEQRRRCPWRPRVLDQGTGMWSRIR